MHKLDEDVNIRYITITDLEKNSKDIMDMLKDNYLINFPRFSDIANHVVSNYSDMKKFINDGSALVIGAYSGIKVVGFLWAYKRLFLGEERLHISHIVVNSVFRGLGVGARMIYFIEEYASKNNIKVIELITSSENIRTIKFYNKHGYDITRVQFEKKIGTKNDN